MEAVMSNRPKAGSGSKGGRGKFGDGRNRPLYEFQASRFKGGRFFTPNVIRVWPDRIEECEPHVARRTDTQAISLQQISEVSLSSGLVWADISVESTGGRSFTMLGIPKADAGRVKKLVDDAVSAFRTSATAPADPAQLPDVGGQLRKLADLRDQGVLTQDEFEAQKAKLLE
jgi:Short C-terminal domain/Bacterial PH domain